MSEKDELVEKLRAQGFEVIDMSAPGAGERLGEKLRAMFEGLAPGETIEIHGPTFDRTDGRTPADVSGWSRKQWDGLRDMSVEQLRELGLQMWDDETPGVALMLLPWEWLEFIPAGYVVTTIAGDSGHFFREQADCDKRYGAHLLSFGVEVRR